MGSLLYLTHTRPDLVHAIGVVSRYMHNPSAHHLGAVKRILHYVAGTINFGLQYEHVNQFRLCGCPNSDWEGYVDNRKSTSGWMFTLGSAAIAWSSKKQDITALSSTEAEYISATLAVCQVVWLKRLLEGLNLKQCDPTVILRDNKSAISIVKNPAMHRRTKHIDTRFHFIRGLVAEGEIHLIHCGTNDQTTDILTKALSTQKHERFRAALGVRSF